MSFDSEGTKQQVESAAAITLADYYDVPLSRVTVSATIDRRLMMARELTSQSWTVVYRIVADESTIARVFDSATELSDADNATALELFDTLMITALTNEGVDNSELVQVFHTAPQREDVTTTEEDIQLPAASPATVPAQHLGWRVFEG